MVEVANNDDKDLSVTIDALILPTELDGAGAFFLLVHC